ncbi:MAG: helix-turn-helix domain-containing protein [Syntrophomonadaceae bacterium]|nr:helix-turn-helix domain-containing protein [Syntrophomonadaceae bacterium]
MMDQNKSYTTEEVAEMLKISKYTVYEMVKRGDLEAYRVGRNLRIQDSDIEAYIIKSKAKDNIIKGSIIRRNGEKYFQAGNVEINLVTESEGEARITIAPEDIILARDTFASSARNVIKGEIKDIIEKGPTVKVLLDVGFPLYATITYKSYKNMKLKIGEFIYAIFKSSAVRVI